MYAEKSPISILQEITQMRNLPPPSYDINPEVTGYKCNGFVSTNITATAIAGSKKQAKHLCAERLLEILQRSQEFTLVFKCFTHSRVCENTSQHLQQATNQLNNPNFNAIGKLNELCSRNCKQVPTYSELGIIDHKYVIECKLLSYTTQGQASTKKRAKQIAAQEMLSRIKDVDLVAISTNTKNEGTKVKSHYQFEMEEKVIELFKHFSVKNNGMKDKHISTTETILITEKQNPGKINSEKLLLEDDMGEKELIAVLNKMGVIYKISKLQEHPLILMLKTNPLNNHPSYTFFHSDTTYDATLLGLLKRSIQDIIVMFN